jgi:hypothetical protein
VRSNTGSPRGHRRLIYILWGVIFRFKDEGADEVKTAIGASSLTSHFRLTSRFRNKKSSWLRDAKNMESAHEDEG